MKKHTHLKFIQIVIHETEKWYERKREVSGAAASTVSGHMAALGGVPMEKEQIQMEVIVKFGEWRLDRSILQTLRDVSAAEVFLSPKVACSEDTFSCCNCLLVGLLHFWKLWTLWGQEPFIYLFDTANHFMNFGLLLKSTSSIYVLNNHTWPNYMKAEIWWEASVISDLWPFFLN